MNQNLLLMQFFVQWIVTHFYFKISDYVFFLINYLTKKWLKGARVIDGNLLTLKLSFSKLSFSTPFIQRERESLEGNRQHFCTFF